MALTTNTKSQTTGICNHAVGQLVTDAAAAAAATISIGFVPRVFRIHNLTDSISYEWFEGMANLAALKTIAAGTRSASTTEGPTLGTDAAGTGTSVTIPAATLLASKTFAWEAIG